MDELRNDGPKLGETKLDEPMPLWIPLIAGIGIGMFIGAIIFTVVK